MLSDSVGFSHSAHISRCMVATGNGVGCLGGGPLSLLVCVSTSSIHLPPSFSYAPFSPRSSFSDLIYFAFCAHHVARFLRNSSIVCLSIFYIQSTRSSSPSNQYYRPSSHVCLPLSNTKEEGQIAIWLGSTLRSCSRSFVLSPSFLSFASNTSLIQYVARCFLSQV